MAPFLRPRSCPVSRSGTCSATRSVACSVTRSVACSVTRSVARPATRSVARPLACSVACSIAFFVAFAAPALAQSPCVGDLRKDVAKAVKLACKGYDKAARRGQSPDISRASRARVGPACLDAVLSACANLSELCYGVAFDGVAGAFPAAVTDRCARSIGSTCSKALFKEIRSPGKALSLLGKIERRCGDPISGDLGGVCDGIVANAAARTCLAGELGAVAGSIDPALPKIPAADCGFPGTSVVKPVVAGAEFDAAISPWLQPITATPVYESPAANQSLIDYIRPKNGGTVNLSTREWTYPIYNVVADPATDCAPSLRSRCFSDVVIEDVYLSAGWNPTGYALLHVPVPAGVSIKPDPRGDSHLAIVDWVHGIEYDFWSCSKNNDGTWRKISWPIAKNGDGEPHYSCKSGGKLFLKGSGSNLIGPDSAKGSGLALTAGLLRAHELQSGGAIITHWPSRPRWPQAAGRSRRPTRATATAPPILRHRPKERACN